MSIVILIIFVLVIGVVLWLLSGKVPPIVITIVTVLLILLVCLWLLDAFGIFPLPAAFHLKGGK